MIRIKLPNLNKSKSGSIYPIPLGDYGLLAFFFMSLPIRKAITRQKMEVRTTIMRVTSIFYSSRLR